MNPITPETNTHELAPRHIHSTEQLSGGLPPEAALGPEDLSDPANHPVLPTLRRIALAASVGWLEATNEELERKRSVNSSSAHRAHKYKGLQPHKDMDTFMSRPSSLSERLQHGRHQRKARKNRRIYYEQQRLAFGKGSDFSSTARLTEVRNAIIPEKEKSEVYRAGYHHRRVSEKYAKLDAKLDRMSNGTDSKSQKQLKKIKENRIKITARKDRIRTLRSGQIYAQRTISS